MKNIIRLIVIFSSISLFSSVNAGTFEVTGSAQATYNTQSGNVNSANGLGTKNHITFAGSGETDFGTFKYTLAQEPGTDGTMDIVDQSLALTSNMGVFAINISAGGLDLEDAGSRSVYARPADAGGADGMVDNLDISSFANMQYHTPAGLLPFGIVGKIAYAPDTRDVSVATATGIVTATSVALNDTNGGGSSTAAAATNFGNMTAYQVTAAPVDGLSVGASYIVSGDNAVSNATQKSESGAVYFKYDVGAVGLGASKALYAPLAANQANQGTEYYEALNYSIAFNVNESMAISYEVETSKKYIAETAGAAQSANVEVESRGIQAAYTVGGMTLAVAHNNHDNIGYSAGKDATNTVFSVAMAF
jgi:hypothetical protein